MLNRRNLFLSLFLIILFLTPGICRAQHKYSQLLTGDLIFEASGNSKFSQAISESTAAHDSLKIVHVGIINISEDGLASVIEASPQHGVREIPLDTFLCATPYTDLAQIFFVKRLSIPFSAEEAIERARSYIGQEYDWWYLPDNNKMYCSELVYESFFDSKGSHIFEARPMNFRSPDGTMPTFWVELFSQLGEPVPEGVAGTNPHALFLDTRLINIPLFQ